MKVPTSYKDLSVSQFMKAYEIKNEDFDEEIDMMTSWISYFTGLSFNEAQSLEGGEYKKYADKLSFLRTDLPLYPISEFVNVDKQLFTPTKTLTKMRVNQMIDFQSIYKANGNNLYKCLDKLLPIVYVQKEYDPNKHEENVKLLSKAKVSEVSGLVFFYSDYWCNVERIIVPYTEKQVNIIAERMKWIAENPQLVPS